MALTKFENIGVELQKSSESKDEALLNFRNSCNICCYRGMHIQCDKCYIKSAHQQVLACFAEYQRIKRNRGMRDAT